MSTMSLLNRIDFIKIRFRSHKNKTKHFFFLRGDRQKFEKKASLNIQNLVFAFRSDPIQSNFQTFSMYCSLTNKVIVVDLLLFSYLSPLYTVKYTVNCTIQYNKIQEMPEKEKIS